MTADPARLQVDLALALPLARTAALSAHHTGCGESSQWDIRRCEDTDCLERAHLLERHGLLPAEWGAYLAAPADTAADPGPRADNYPPEHCGRVAAHIPHLTAAEPEAGQPPGHVDLIRFCDGRTLVTVPDAGEQPAPCCGHPLSCARLAATVGIKRRWS